MVTVKSLFLNLKQLDQGYNLVAKFILSFFSFFSALIIDEALFIISGTACKVK